MCDDLVPINTQSTLTPSLLSPSTGLVARTRFIFVVAARMKQVPWVLLDPSFWHMYQTPAKFSTKKKKKKELTTEHQQFYKSFKI